MQLDDLIGLLFFVFFVILPALSGLLRRGQQPPDLDEPEIPQPRPQPPQTSQPQRTPQPAQPPTRAAQRPQPAQPRPVQPPRPELRPQSDATRKLQTPPSAPAGEHARQQQIEQTRPLTRSGQTPVPATPVKKAIPQPLSADKDAILKGMIWRQILEEPRGKHWQRSWAARSAGRRRRRPRV